MVYISLQVLLPVMTSEEVSEACLSSVFVRALCEGKAVSDIPLPPDSDLARVAKEKGKSIDKSGKLSPKDALAILHDLELELRSQACRAAPAKGNHKEPR